MYSTLSYSVTLFITLGLNLAVSVTGANNVCVKEGYQPQPNNPHGFSRCVHRGTKQNGEPIFAKYDFDCADGTVFDPMLSNCNFPPSEYDTGLKYFRNCLHEEGIPPLSLVERDVYSKEYSTLNHQWNLRIAKVYPIAYFLPNSTGDVASAVKCGVQSNLHLIPNSGGHSYEAISFGNNQTVVVDFRRMQKVEIVERGASAAAWIEPGALLGPITAYLWRNGGYGVPAGNCLTVGMGGHAIGGGVGFFSQVFGLTLDNLLEAEMVDAQGRIVRIGPNSAPDLFWAIRGVGPGYIGILTGFKLRLFDARRLKLSFLKLRYKNTDFVEVWDSFQKFSAWAEKNEPTTFTGITISNDKTQSKTPPIHPGIDVHLLHIHDRLIQPQGNNSFLQAIRDIFPADVEVIPNFNLNYLQFVIYSGYVPVILPQRDGGNILVGRLDDPLLYPDLRAGESPLFNEDKLIYYLNQLKKEIAIPRYYKTKSMFIKNVFSKGEMKKVGKLVSEIPPGAWIMINTEQGAIHGVGRTETSCVHRNSLHAICINYEGSPERDAVKLGMTWRDAIWNEIQFMDGEETYQNYPDLDMRNYYQRVYQENFERLTKVKTNWDSNNYFQNPVSIPVNFHL